MFGQHKNKVMEVCAMVSFEKDILSSIQFVLSFFLFCPVLLQIHWTQLLSAPLPQSFRGLFVVLFVCLVFCFVFVCLFFFCFELVKAEK